MNLHRTPASADTTDLAHPLAHGAAAPAGRMVKQAHREPADAVVAALGSDTARGLSRAEAHRRLDQYGPNQLKSAPETPWWRRLLEQFENFLVIILLVATVIS